VRRKRLTRIYSTNDSNTGVIGLAAVFTLITSGWNKFKEKAKSEMF